MGITKSEAIANHRKMWNWIADETLRQERKVEKWEYFKANEITDIPYGECYCCEYVNNRNCADCSDCPIDWGGKYGSCTDINILNNEKGLFSLWCDESDYIKSAELAKRIAELPERK